MTKSTLMHSGFETMQHNSNKKVQRAHMMVLSRPQIRRIGCSLNLRNWGYKNGLLKIGPKFIFLRDTRGDS